MQSPASWIERSPLAVNPGLVPWVRRNADLAVVTTVALLAGLIALVSWGGILGRLLPYDDSLYYAAMARSIAEGHGPFVQGASGAIVGCRFPPGFSLLLAPMWWLARTPSGALWLFQIAVVTSMVFFFVLAYWLLTRRWGISRLAAGLAVGLAVFNPVSLLVSSSLMSDFTGALAALVLLALADRLRPGTPGVRGLQLGLLGAACLLIRFATAPAVVVAGWLMFRRGGLRTLGAFAAGVVAPILLWELYALRVPGPGYLDDLRTNLSLDPEATGLVPLAFATARRALFGGLPAWVPPLSGLSGVGILGRLAPGTVAFGGLSQPRIGVMEVAGDLLLAAGLVRGAREPRARAMTAYVALTAAVIPAWCWGFGIFGWWIPARILVPAAPLWLGLSLDWLIGSVNRMARRLVQIAGNGRESFQALAGGWPGVVVGLALATSAVPPVYGFLKHYTSMGLFLFRGAQEPQQIGQVLARIPEREPVGATYPLLAYFYSGRRYLWVDTTTVGGYLKARHLGVRFIWVMPKGDAFMNLTYRALGKLLAEGRPAASVVFRTHVGHAVVYLGANARPKTPPGGAASAGPPPVAIFLPAKATGG